LSVLWTVGLMNCRSCECDPNEIQFILRRLQKNGIWKEVFLYIRRSCLCKNSLCVRDFGVEAGNPLNPGIPLVIWPKAMLVKSIQLLLLDISLSITERSPAVRPLSQIKLYFKGKYAKWKSNLIINFLNE
jgi:hypothetical protein